MWVQTISGQDRSERIKSHFKKWHHTGKNYNITQDKDTGVLVYNSSSVVRAAVLESNSAVFSQIK